MNTPFPCLMVSLLGLLAPFGVGAQALQAAPALPAAPVIPAALVDQVREMALSGAAGTPVVNGLPVRFHVDVGALDPRLKLAPCERIEPFLPVGATVWGRSRVGLRCAQGPTRWTVYLPISVQAWTAGWVTTAALAAGTELTANHLVAAEVDLAAGSGTAILQRDAALGHSLQRPLAAGAALRTTDLRSRQWFAAGDTVRVLAGGSGFQVATEGQAMNPGIEGQLVKVRIEGGRTVQGRAAGERLVEVLL